MSNSRFHSGYWLHGAALILALAAGTFGCSSDSGGVTIGNGSNGGSNGSGSNGGATGGSVSTNGGASNGSGGSSIAFGGSTGNVGTGGASNGMPEVCDGTDNDANGIIDDVDVGNDGVCDCLNIATLGQIGPWSNGGNVFASWLDARSPMGAVALDDQVLTEELLRPYQVIVALHVGTMEVKNDDRTAAAHHAFSDAEVEAFHGWVKNGGGAMSTIGYFGDESKEVVNINRLLSPLGLGYSPTKLDLNGFVNDWMQHPVTMGISNIKTDNGVEPDDMGTTLARGSNQRLALKVSEVGQGRVVVWGDEWITYDSEWADTENQQVELFWVNILKWLSPPNRCQVPIPPEIVK
ncbi:MAG: hypothetical protein ACOY0T_16765 [Myxococcota bacterium]